MKNNTPHNVSTKVEYRNSWAWFPLCVGLWFLSLFYSILEKRNPDFMGDRILFWLKYRFTLKISDLLYIFEFFSLSLYFFFNFNFFNIICQRYYIISFFFIIIMNSIESFYLNLNGNKRPTRFYKIHRKVYNSISWYWHIFFLSFSFLTFFYFEIVSFSFNQIYSYILLPRAYL